jgi:hypothetical protein
MSKIYQPICELTYINYISRKLKYKNNFLEIYQTYVSVCGLKVLYYLIDWSCLFLLKDKTFIFSINLVRTLVTMRNVTKNTFVGKCSIRRYSLDMRKTDFIIVY